MRRTCSLSPPTLVQDAVEPNIHLLLRIPIFLPATQRSIYGPRGPNSQKISSISPVRGCSAIPFAYCPSVSSPPVPDSLPYPRRQPLNSSAHFTLDTAPGVLVGVRRQGWTNSKISCEWYVRALARDESDASEEDGCGRGGTCIVMEARTNERMRESRSKTTQITSTLDRRVG
jgi:hypothetical protein